MAVQITRKRFTVHDYHRMADADILGGDDRVELIEGEILTMSPIGPPHGAAVDRANRAMVNVTGDKAIGRVQGSVNWTNLANLSPISCCCGRRMISMPLRFPAHRTFS